MGKKEKKEKKGIILVLSGGGAKGLAHIGVIEEFEKHNILIKRVIGTSAGALIGGVYAAGKLGKIKKFFLDMTKKDVFKLFFSFPSLSAIFNSKKLDNLVRGFTKEVEISELEIPFNSVAFDIISRKKVVFESGDLFDAIRSSISIPGFFKPFKWRESFLIDGGVIDVVPTDVAKKYSKKDLMVVVNIETHPILKKHKFNLVSILDAALYAETIQLARLQEKDADVIIHPDVQAGHFEYYHAKRIILAGRTAAKKAIPGIKKLLRKKNKR
jgi:NTE family protein